MKQMISFLYNAFSTLLIWYVTSVTTSTNPPQKTTLSSGFQSHTMHKVHKQKNIISIRTTFQAFFDYETNSPFP